MQRESAATLRETSDVKALTVPLDTPILPREFIALEERPDPSTRARYLELQALDVHIRERARAHNMATAELGRLTQKLVADVDRLDREAAMWPQRAIDAVQPQLSELRKPLIERRDQLLVAYERAVRMQSQLEALRARVSERRA